MHFNCCSKIWTWFHPTIYEEYASSPKDKGELRESKLFFHVRRNKHEDDDSDEEDDEHDLDEKPCLNRILGMSFPNEDEKWLQPIMCPSVTIYAGAEKFNPVVVFMLTHLAPGWAGGVLTAVVYTWFVDGRLTYFRLFYKIQ